MYSGKKKSETLKVEMKRKKKHCTKGKETRGPRNANWSSPRGAKALPYLTLPKYCQPGLFVLVNHFSRLHTATSVFWFVRRLKGF